MEDIILQGNNPLWFVDESTGLMEYTQGGLANQIFEIVDIFEIYDKNIMEYKNEVKNIDELKYNLCLNLL